MRNFINGNPRGEDLKAAQQNIKEQLKPVSKDERETITTRIDGDKAAVVYTSSPKTMNAIFKMQLEHPEHIKIRWYDEYGVQFDVDAKMTRLSPPRREKTAEEKAAINERMRCVREARRKEAA